MNVTPPPAGAGPSSRPMRVFESHYSGLDSWSSPFNYRLLRAGRRITYEDTRGSAWHAIVGLAAPLAKDVNLGLSFEYLRIQSTGTHRWTDSLANADMSWDHGVEVWSEQKSVNLKLQYVF